MSTLAELESKFEKVAAIREAAKYDSTITNDKMIELAREYRALHTQVFAARKEAAAAQHPSTRTPELIGVPTLAQLESKWEEYETIIQKSKSDWTIPNAKKREMSIERKILHCELIAARREAAAAKQQELYALEDEALKRSTEVKSHDGQGTISTTKPTMPTIPELHEASNQPEDLIGPVTSSKAKD